MSEQPSLPWYARLNQNGSLDETMIAEMMDYYGEIPDWIVPGMTAVAFNLTHYEPGTRFAGQLRAARIQQKQKQANVGQ